MRDHRKLKAFQLADSLVLSVYANTRTFPREELFGLTSQIRRAAISVAANIVEGCGREGQNEFANFLNISNGSLRELGYLIDIARRLNYLPASNYNLLMRQIDGTARTLAGLHSSMKSKR